MKNKTKCININNPIKRWYYSNCGHKDYSQYFAILCIICCILTLIFLILSTEKQTYVPSNVESNITTNKNICFNIVKKDSFKIEDKEIIQFNLYERNISIPFINNYILKTKIPINFELSSAEFDKKLGLNNNCIYTDVHTLNIQIPLNKKINTEKITKQLNKQLNNSYISNLNTSLYINDDFNIYFILNVDVIKLDKINGSFSNDDITSLINLIKKEINNT